ncbi:4Fe-4S dicluster domain-containing protein [Desulfuromonas sp. TF]|jgi:Fe-S-cluster-containing dehydrogenase component|uniref:4Fe-4S dicluster domain-containing protein n=1 Tax=Desulfuromonas sp. TF TaxID=1232410 RepID=UPI000425F2AB|nr:4Fe-4S dicluster domain-containing protein [Desulfuromonas sp. TF]
MTKKQRFGLLIDYEYCTGCHACEVACAQEYGWPPGMGGMRVIEVIQRLPKDKAYLNFITFPTESCVLCAGRTRKGQKPSCVHHCLAGAIKYGPIEELAKEMERKPRMVLWAPK